MPSTRLPDNQEDREVYLREHRAGRFVELVLDAHRAHTETVLMTVKAFAGEPENLYVALDYAYHEGLSVTMAAKVDDDRSGPTTSREVV